MNLPTLLRLYLDNGTAAASCSPSIRYWSTLGTTYCNENTVLL